MYDFRTDSDLSGEQKKEIAGNNRLETAYEIKRFEDEERKYREEYKKDKEERLKKQKELFGDLSDLEKKFSTNKTRYKV